MDRAYTYPGPPWPPSYQLPSNIHPSDPHTDDSTGGRTICAVSIAGPEERGLGDHTGEGNWDPPQSGTLTVGSRHLVLDCNAEVRSSQNDHVVSAEGSAEGTGSDDTYLRSLPSAGRTQLASTKNALHANSRMGYSTHIEGEVPELSGIRRKSLGEYREARSHSTGLEWLDKSTYSMYSTCEQKRHDKAKMCRGNPGDDPDTETKEMESNLQSNYQKKVCTAEPQSTNSTATYAQAKHLDAAATTITTAAARLENTQGSVEAADIRRSGADQQGLESRKEPEESVLEPGPKIDPDVQKVPPPKPVSLLQQPPREHTDLRLFTDDLATYCKEEIYHPPRKLGEITLFEHWCHVRGFTLHYEWFYDEDIMDFTESKVRDHPHRTLHPLRYFY